MMNSILGGRNSKNKQMPDVVPETPEGSSSRSRRTSTLNSSAATRSFLMQSSKSDQTPGSRGSKTEQTRVEQTPDNTVQLGHKTIIAETPDDTVLDATKVSDVENRAASLGIFSDSPPLLSPAKSKSIMKVKHGPKMRQLPTLLPTEESFILSTQQQVNSTFVDGQRDASLESTSAPSPSVLPTPEREVKSPIITNVSSSSRRKKGRPVKISREVSPSKDKQVSRDVSPIKEKQISRQISPAKEKHELEVEKHKNRLKAVETSSLSMSKEKDILDILDAESALVSANSEKELEIEKHKHRLGLVDSNVSMESKGKDLSTASKNKAEDFSVASEKKGKTSSLASESKEKEPSSTTSEIKDKESEIEKHRNRLKLAESSLPSPSKEKEPETGKPKTQPQPTRETELDIEKHKKRLKLAESSLASQSKEKQLEIEKHKNRLKLAESNVASKSKDKDLEIEKHKTSLKLAQSNLASLSREKELEIDKHRNRLELAELSKALASRGGNNLEVENQIQRKASPSRGVNDLEVEKHRHRLQLTGSSRASPSREKIEPPRRAKTEAPSKEKTDADVEKHRNRLKSAESSRASFGLGEKVKTAPKDSDKNNVTLDLSEKNTSRVSLRLLQEKPFSPSQDNCDEGLDLSKVVSNESDTSLSLPHPVLSHVKSGLAPVYESEKDSYENIGLNLSGTGQTSPEKPNGKITQPVNYKLQAKSVSASKNAKSAATPKSSATPKSAARNKKEDNRRSRRSNVNKDDFLNFLFQKEKSPDRNAQLPLKIDSPVSDNIFAKNSSDSDSGSEDGWDAMMSSDGSTKKYLPTIDPSRKSVVISGNIKSKTKQNLEKPSANALLSKPSRKNLIDEFGKNPGKNSPKHAGGKAVRVVNEKAKENIYEIDGLGELQEEKSGSEENEKSLFIVDESNVTLSRRRSQKVQPQKSKLASISESDSSSLSKVLNVSTSSQNISSTRTVSSKSLGNLSSASSSTSTLYPRGGAKPLSFQDFSTDSAKALIGMFEKGDYHSDGEDKTSTADKAGTEKEAKENCGNIPKVVAKTNSLKRKSTTLAETPGSKRSRNLLQVPGATEGIDPSPTVKVAEDLIPSSAVKATPARSKQAALKDKTSLSPIPMELCESPLVRRSSRASTHISTVASDSLSKRSLSPLATGGKSKASPEVMSSDFSEKLKPKSSENGWKPPTARDIESNGRKSTLKSKPTVKNKASDGPIVSDVSVKGVDEPISDSPSCAPTQPPPTPTQPPPTPTQPPPIPTFMNPRPPTIPTFMNPPPPQVSPTESLKGKIVYVEYYADNENRSKVLKQICGDLGAEVVEKLTANVTHFVFKDGNPANYMKAKKFGIHIVSATWVEDCKKEMKVVAEDLYPSISKEKYDSPGLFAKLKKGKSMQVRDLEEDVERARIAQERKAKTLEKKKQKEKEETDKKKSFNIKMPTHEHYYKANGRVAKTKAMEPSGLNDMLAEFQSPSGSPLKLQRIADISFSPKNPSDDDFDTPLAKRIAAKYRSPAIQISGCEDTPSSSTKPLAKPLIGESPLTLATPNPGDKKKSINRRVLAMDDSIEEKKQAANKSKEVESQMKSPATEPRRRSGRASTQIVTKATTSVCNQKEQAKTSPSLDPASQMLLSRKDSESLAVPPVKDSSFLSVPSKKALNQVDSSQDKTADDSILDETDYGSPILESTRAEPKSKKSNVESSKSAKAPTTPKGNSKYPPPKNAKKNVESELLFDSLLQGGAVEKDKNTEPPAESERLFDSLLQSSSTVEKKVPSKGRRDRSLLPFPSTTTSNEVTPTSKKVAKLLKSAKPPEVKIPEKSPEQSALSINKSPRVIAPWRHLKELNNEEPDAGTDDVYEFTGFGDDPLPSSEETSTVKPRKKAASKPPLPATTSPPIGRPSTNRMFSIGLPARKRKLDESPSKSQSGIGSTKEKSEVCPAIQKTPATPVTPTEVLDASPNLSTVENITTITSEGVFVTEHQNTTKKHVLLSKIFSKPPAKETDSKQINSESEEELKSTKKHKLFNQKEDILDQTASPSAVRDTQHIPNVHTGEPNVATQSKTVIVKNKDKDGVFAQPPKSSSFKKPKKQKPRVTKRKARSSSSESSEQSDSDSASSEGNGYPSSLNSQSSQGSKNNSQVKKLKPPRRSSLEFQPLPKFARKMSEKSIGDDEGVSQSLAASAERGSQRGKRGRKVSPSNNIVCTSCHKDDISLVRELIKKFGKFSFSDSVNIHTSHVISGEGKRTLNLLKGLLQGCWLVTKEWVLASLEEGKWTDEEPYEMVDFSPAVRSVRLDRSAFEGAFKSDLFRDCGVVYVSTNCRAPREELKQLIISGGGSVANLVKVSDIIVGEDRSDITTCCVTEKWILDSIQFHVIMPFADYSYLSKESE